jgi:uncharacterized protein (TIGR02646 family)
LRPVRRGKSPILDNFKDYTDSKVDLISRIGSYCSYCERKIDTNLAVEHIEPKKGEYGKPDLIGRWDNFLLACVNCNSTKGSKQVIFKDLFLPDRDNTFLAFTYLADGSVIPRKNLSSIDDTIAQDTLSLVGLDKQLKETKDVDGNLIAMDRASQRIEIWGTAEESLEDYCSNRDNEAFIRSTVKLMISNGFFSVWMTVFEDYPEMKNHFINAMCGTNESGCFKPILAQTISPHPNNDNLNNGGKI